MARAPVRLVLGDLGRDVEVGEHVAVEDEEALVEVLLGELDCTGGAERFGLFDVTDRDALVTGLVKRGAQAVALGNRST